METASCKRCMTRILILISTFMFASGTNEGFCQKQIIHTAEKPLSPEDACISMQLPDGFYSTLFAAEPDVMQPIGFCLDDRNRIWVAEAYNYPRHGDTPGDRIVILEDTNGDGVHDKRKIFFDGLNYITGIEVGFGGVWVMSPPSMYFIADSDLDDQPDSAPTVLLDGFGNHANAHNLANGFAWGPDGWLYATHGRTNWSMIGKPGTPTESRVRFDGGVWRYHPTNHHWEAVADGTTNPWGIDWNDYGDAFICNCVNPHLFHVIPGAHYEPWRGRKSSQYAFQRIDTIADHLHYVGLGNVRNGLGSAAEDAAGGGHAHCGTMIYLGNAFPASYRNKLFTNNIHGKRINQEQLEFHGSGYTASHGKDLMKSSDPWFMGVTLAYGAGGEVYVSDWSDTGECHSTRNTRRETGRIFRITYGKTTTSPIDLQRLTTMELAQLQMHRNDWMVRHARRILQERHHANQPMTEARILLRSKVRMDQTVPRRLRALWALHVTGGLTDTELKTLMDDSSPFVQQWAIRLACENQSSSVNWIDTLTKIAEATESPRVRLELASSLQRIPLTHRWRLAEALSEHSIDKHDQNIPLMLWYGIEPLIDVDIKRYVQLAFTSKIPQIRENISRRIALSESSASHMEILFQGFTPETDIAIASDILGGILTGYSGRRSVSMPMNWQGASMILANKPNPEVQRQMMHLALLFDDPKATRKLIEIVNDKTHDPDVRKDALTALVTRKHPGTENLLTAQLEDAALRLTALNGLAQIDNAGTSSAILAGYPSYEPDEKQAALNALATTPPKARALLAGIVSGVIKRSDLTAFTARQIQTHGNEELNQQLAHLWGTVTNTPKTQKQAIAKYLQTLTTENIAEADLQRGKQLYAQHCGTCHRFFGEGGNIGPDLTGTQRTNIAYLLENIVSPNSSVSKDFQMSILRTVDGQVITGLLRNRTAQVITISNAQGTRAVPANEVEQLKITDVSVMPTGLLDSLSEREIRDLFGYMQKK